MELIFSTKLIFVKQHFYPENCHFLLKNFQLNLNSNKNKICKNKFDFGILWRKNKWKNKYYLIINQSYFFIYFEGYLSHFSLNNIFPVGLRNYLLMVYVVVVVVVDVNGKMGKFCFCGIFCGFWISFIRPMQ